MVPINLQGNILYPLNELKEIHPDLYEQKLKKYAGREQILLHVIPVLNCLWNDVLHFSAVNPKELKQALADAGGNGNIIMKCFKVDPNLIKPENAIVFLYSHSEYKDKLNEENFIPFNPDDVAKYSSMPQASKDYYRETISLGKRPLLFHRIPHILYKGKLDISGLEIVTV